MRTPRIQALAATTLTAALLAACLPAQEEAASKPEVAKPKPDSRPHKEPHRVATLGIETRAPSKEESIKYFLKLEVRYQGQVVTRLARRSAAARAGIRKGDIILKIEKVEIFSEDDIRDIVMVRKPGQKIVMDLIRGKTKKKTSVEVKLGGKKIRAPKEPRLEWDYAGLGYLKDALAKANTEQKHVLVGLSGAET
ncbi:MAG: PDZ domain-containing protein [Planctomycetota bacterium]